MYKELKAPLYIQWEVTSCCNFHCIHCYNGWRSNENIKASTSYYSQIVEEILKNEVFRVTITGGEPILVFRELKPHLLKLTETGIEVSLNTNASLITVDIAKEIKQIGINHVLVSVPCGDELICAKITKCKDAFKQTMKGIHNLLECDIAVSVNMVISKENLYTIYKTASLFKNMKIETFAATRASTPYDYDEFSKYRIDNKQLSFMFDNLLKINRDFHLNVSSLEFYPYCAFYNEEHFRYFGGRQCSAGRTEAAISSDGLIRPCPHTSISYGSINSGLEAAWHAMDEDWRSSKMIPTSCKQCKYWITCAGGCKQEAYAKSGSLNAIDPMAMPICNHKFEKISKKVLKDYYVVNEKLKTRMDKDEAVVLYAPNGKWQLVSKKLADLLLEKKTINQKILRDSLGIQEEESEKVLSILVYKTIVI